MRTEIMRTAEFTNTNMQVLRARVYHGAHKKKKCEKNKTGGRKNNASSFLIRVLPAENERACSVA
jgi:hypothetical protein